GGVYRKPHSYTAVYDRNGNQILENSGDGERVISEESAFIMTKMLENVVQTGTAKGMGISKSVSVAGKTGTSNADTDRFFIGYTPDYICGIWFGYVDARSLGYYKTNPACAVFDKVMSKAYSLYPEKAANTFVCPENVVKCLYCRDSGLLPDSACICDARGNRIELGYFKKGTEPQSHCDTHILVDYDISDGGVVFDGENTKKVALVKNYSRSFPCDVKISDAQYTYRFLSPLCEPSKNENEAYFQSLQKENEFFGTSNVSRAFNRFYKKKDENIPEISPDIATPPEESREYEDE
ncbi:MAG: hypothetical protein KBS59_04975, partial [Clostridiales bacterium]|nr:hypothetical protein [Clostridiales bacterium]